MSDAACAEEEEGLLRVITRAGDLLRTVQRVERGELTVQRAAIEKSRDAVLSALEALNRADDLVCGAITACKGCPTDG